MKECPVCKARCFDDMAVCYGCMHDFRKDGNREGDAPSLGGGRGGSACEPGRPSQEPSVMQGVKEGGVIQADSGLSIRGNAIKAEAESKGLPRLSLSAPSGSLSFIVSISAAPLE